MKLGAPYLVNGFACLLLAGVIFVACGSDEGRRAERDVAGAAGEGGDGPAPAAGGTPSDPIGGNGGALPVSSAGMGGEPTVVGGMGGETAGQAGAAQLPLGGEGGTLNEGGAGGAGP